MTNEYKGSWAIPATDHEGMLPDIKKAIDESEAVRQAGTPLEYGKGTETHAVGMIFDIRNILSKALGAEAGIYDQGGELSTQIATMHYGFARSAIGGDNVHAAKIDFEVKNAVIIPSQSGAQELHLTTASSIHRVMKTGERAFHISAEETMIFALRDTELSKD